MSGISPSLLHSIKLKQSAPVRVGGFPYAGRGGGVQAKGCSVSSVPEAMSGNIFRKRLS